MSQLGSLAAAAALLVVAAVTGGGATAVAKPIERGTIHNEDSFVLSDFCGVAGLDIDFVGVTDVEFSIRSKGSAQVPYSSRYFRGTSTWTNPDNGHFVTESFNVLDKELKVTDNGDGTFTILVLATGNSTVSGMDGKPIARDPGRPDGRS